LNVIRFRFPQLSPTLFSLFCLTFGFCTAQKVAVAAEYTTTNVSVDQEDVTLAITNNLTQDNTYTGLLFESTTGTSHSFSYVDDVTVANEYPSNTGTRNDYAAYQSMRFVNTSTASAWSLRAWNTSGGTKTATAGVRTLTLENTQLNFVDTGSGTTLGYIRDFLINGALNFSNGHLDTTGSLGTSLTFSGDSTIDVTGSDNILKAPNQLNQSIHSLLLNLNASSTLDVTSNTEIASLLGGRVALASGSQLDINNSRVYMTTDGTNPSTMTSASINIAGDFGSSPASLYVTDPAISDSTITLDSGTQFASLKHTSSTAADSGSFFFTGNNTVQMEFESQLLGNPGSGSHPAGAASFSNGTTNLTRIGVAGGLNPSVRTSAIELDNATVTYSDVDLSSDLSRLTVENGSSFSTTGSADYNRQYPCQPG
jgi:hypothetical protein